MAVAEAMRRCVGVTSGICGDGDGRGLCEGFVDGDGLCEGGGEDGVGVGGGGVGNGVGVGATPKLALIEPGPFTFAVVYEEPALMKVMALVLLDHCENK